MIESMAGRGRWRLTACLLALAGTAGATQEPQVFRSAVDLTRVAVAVLDGDGMPVEGLTAADFRVSERGRQREVQVVLAPDNAALDVGVVIDFSTSIAEDWPEARQAAHEFLDSLQPADCVFLVPFNDRVGPGAWGTRDTSALRALIDEFPMQGLTHLYDAVRVARDALLDRQLLRQKPSLTPPGQGHRAGCDGGETAAAVARRQALVVITDGADLGSETAYGDLLIGSWRAEVPVFSVAVGVAATSLRMRFLRRGADEIELLQEQLGELARVTGGQFFMQQRLRSGYAEVLNVLRGLYVVAFRGEATTEWADVEVSVPGSRHRVIVQPRILRVDAASRSGMREVRRGLLLASVGRLGEAETALLGVVAAEPEDLAPNLYLGMVREALGRPAEARQAFRAALAIAPGAMAAHAGVARTSLAMGDTDAAWEHAIAARQAGADVSTVIQALRDVPEPADLEERLQRQVVGLIAPTTPDLQALLAIRHLRRRLAALLQEDGFAVTANTLAADVLLNLRIDEFEPRPDTGGRLRARIELWSLAGEEQVDRTLQIDDLRDAAGVDRVLQAVLPPLLERMREPHD